MPGRLVSHQYLRETQAVAVTQATARVRGAVGAMPGIVDSLFQLGQVLRVTPDETGVGAWCFGALISAPYTVAEAFDLLVRASYLESVILFRHLLEVLVQIRFYQQQPGRFVTDQNWAMARAGAQLPTGARRTRPDFKTMFERIAPGYYDAHYGPQISNAAHGGMAASLYRFTVTGEGGPRSAHAPGAHFNEGLFGYVLTHLAPVLHGLIRINLTLCPDALDRAGEPTRTTVTSAQGWLAECLQSDWNQFPAKRPLLRQLQTVADWQPIAITRP